MGREWTTGNLSFHTMPPEEEGKVQDAIQSEMSEELDLDKMFIGSENNSEMDDGENNKAMTVLFKNSGAEGVMNVKVEKAKKSRKRKSGDEMEEEDDVDGMGEEESERLKDLKHLGLPEDHGRDLSNASSGKDLQKLMKKRRKQLKKSRVVAQGFADDLEDMNFADM